MLCARLLTSLWMAVSLKWFCGLFPCVFLLFQGITFDEFRSFFQFLNNLEDFAIAMQMYNFASRSIGQGRKRAGATGTEGLISHTQLVCFFPLAWCKIKWQKWSKRFSLSLLPDEFARAVYVATGLKLTRHLVHTIFKIFDVDHDDQLSYKEFIGIMKDRLHRGARVRNCVWKKQKDCCQFRKSALNSLT